MEMSISIYLWITLLGFVAETESAAPVYTKKTAQYELRFFHVGKTFSSAKSFCEDRNSKLVEIKDETITAAVDAGLTAIGGSASHWIGATDQDTESEWKWIDGSSLEYTNWNYNEPTNTTAENCAVVGGSSSEKWRDKPCTMTFFPICQTDLNSVIFSNNTEYTFYRYTEQGGSLSMNFNEARTACQQRGFKLVEIKSSAVEDKLNKDLKDRNEANKHYWTSGNDLDSEGTWVWGDGSSFVYENWLQWSGSPDEPNGGINENCLIKYYPRDWKWSDFPCSSRGGYICQKDVSSGTCSSDLCSNHGTCTVNNGKYQCSCEDGFVGDKCHREPCKSNPCQNGRSCSVTNQYPNYDCSCASAYEGKQCKALIHIWPTKNNTVALKGEFANITLNVISYDGPVIVKAYRDGDSSPFDTKTDIENGTMEFTIGPVDETSAGFYDFRAYPMSLSYYKPARAEITVHVPATITNIQPQNRIIPGSYDASAKIYCYASGNPQPEVNWYRNDALVTEVVPSRGIYQSKSSGRTDLLLSRADKSDAGIYTCVAKNTVGEEGRKIVVNGTAVARVSISLVSSNPEPGNIKFTDLVDVNCTYEGFPAPDVRWKWRREGRLYNISINEPGSLFHVANSAVTIDGVYHVTSHLRISLAKSLGPVNVSCFGTNSYETSTETTFNLNQYPLSVHHGRSYFTYSAEGHYRDRSGAQTFCEGIGGSLASIPDQETQDFVALKTTLWSFAHYVHIGLKREVVNGVKLWKWPSGAVVYNETNHGSWTSSEGRITDGKYVGWVNGQPSSNVGYDCGFISRADSFYWANLPCSDTRRFICETKVQGIPENVTIQTEECSSSFTVILKPNENAIGIKHRIQMRPINSSVNEKPVTMDVIPQNILDYYKVSNFEPFTTYNVTVAVAPEYSLFELSRNFIHTTGAGILNPVRDAKMIHLKENKLCTVIWTPSNGGPGTITGYHITKTSSLVYSRNETMKVTEKHNMTGGTTQFAFNTLPNLNYTITIQAINCVGLGRSSIASGSCVSEREAPTSVPQSVVSNKLNTDGTMNIKVYFANESNGPVSCYFVIVQIGDSRNSQDFTKQDLTAAQILTEPPSQTTKYIAIAISRSEVKTEYSDRKLGDGSRSSCNLQHIYGEERNKRSTDDVVIEARNWPLEESKTYIVFVVASVPVEGNVLFQVSEELIVTNEPEGSNLIVPITVSVAVVIALAFTVLAVVCIMKRRKQNKKQQTVTEPSNEGNNYEMPDKYLANYENIGADTYEPVMTQNDTTYEQPVQQQEIKTDSNPYATITDRKPETSQQSTSQL